MNYKQKVQKLQDELDQELGKMKRLLLQGWVSKPAWLRACVWVAFGGITTLALR